MPEKGQFQPLGYVQILNQEEARFNSADMNIAYRMGVDEYQQLCPYAEALEENWGKPPGTPALASQHQSCPLRLACSC